MKHLFFLFLIAAFSTANASSSVLDTPKTDKRFTKQQLLSDVDYLTSTIANVHPNMYHDISKGSYLRLVDSIKASLNEGMTSIEMWPIIAPLVGRLNEGHSSFSLPEELLEKVKTGKRIFFPVIFKEFDGKYFVVHADASLEDVMQVGDKVKSINGIEAAKLVDLLSKHMGGLKSWRAVDVCDNLVAYLELYGIKAPYNVTYVRNQKEFNCTLNASSFAEINKRFSQKLKQQQPVPKQVNYAFNFLEHNMGYLVLNSLRENPEKFKLFLDSAFRLLKQKNANRLIIDLRLNGGGNSALGEMLLTYIAQKPFRMTGGVKWKVSQEYKDAIKSRSNGEIPAGVKNYFEAKNGTFLESGKVKLEPLSKNELAFTGNVMVLIGSKTFSSANMLANTMKDYKIATFIGEATGEPANDYGELIYLKLPNSGIPFSTSTKEFIRANGDAKDRNPVLPHYKIVDDIQTTADEVLLFAKTAKKATS